MAAAALLASGPLLAWPGIGDLGKALDAGKVMLGISQAESVPSAAADLPSMLPARNESPGILGHRAEEILDYDTAAHHYGEAVARADHMPAMFRSEALRAALPDLVRVLIVLNRLNDADLALQRLNALPSPPLVRPGATGLADAVAVLSSAFQTAVGSARAMNQRIDYGDELGDRDKALAYRLPQTRSPAVLDALIRARQQRPEAVRAIWHGAFQAELQQKDRPDQSSFLTGAEVDCWLMALALRQAGARVEASQAMQQALARQSAITRQLIGSVGSADVLLGSFQQYRWMAASAAELSLGGDPLQTDSAIGALAVGRGLATRWTRQRSTLLASLRGSSAAKARRDLAELQAQAADLPTAGNGAVEAWGQWSNAVHTALQPVMKDLAAAGLPDIVETPDEVVAAARKALRPGETIIGFVQYQPVTAGDPRPAPARYLRYVLWKEGAQLLDIGPRREIDNDISAWRASGSGAARHAIGMRLAQQLLGGLPTGAVSATHWSIDSDGMVGLLPFEALPETGGPLVIDRHAVRYLTSLAQVGGTAAPAREGRSSAALVLANPAYAGSAAPDRRAGLRGVDGTAWRDMVFSPLPETSAEADAVAASLRSMGMSPAVLRGTDATPEALTAADAPAIVHVASHGFVLAPAPESDGQTRHRLRVMMPGQLAGLALAANGRRGGILMASDLESANLRDTRLLVLSACDTGNGQVDVHEGLASLRRAAEAAGVRATVTSLWPVPSKPTVQLMKNFYSALANGQTHSEALRTAKLAMQRSGAPVRDWAGFVVAGADR